MRKTKLHISPELLASLMIFACFFGGYTISFIIAGYILLCEDDKWLKNTTIKSIVIMVAFTLVTSIIKIFPTIMSPFDDIASSIGMYLFYSKVIDFINFICNFIYFAEKIIFIVLGFVALSGKFIKFPLLDKFIEKHSDFSKDE